MSLGRTNDQTLSNKPLGAYTKQGGSELVDALFNTQHLAGTKARGNGRRGLIPSMLNSDIVADERNVRRRNLGRGRVKFQVLEGDLKKSGIEIGGRIHFPDANDVITIIDGGVVDEMVSQEKERREYLEKMIEDCSLGDEICAQLCGFNSVQDLANAGLGAGRQIIGLKPQLDADLVAASGMPSDIEVLSEDSIQYSRAIKLLKIFVAHHLPAIENYTSDKVKNADVA